MADPRHKYIIVGGGLAGDAAIDGIREIDKSGSILLIGSERHLPYHRPPLSKPVWFKKTHTKDVFVHDSEQYAEHGVRLLLGTTALRVDAQNRVVTDSTGRAHRYEKLLLATGGQPRRLGIPGGNLPGLCYFRTLDDFRMLRSEVEAGMPVLTIGGGFIGSEMAAALRVNEAQVTMLFPGPYLMRRVFPEGLGRAVTDQYRHQGIRVLAEDVPVLIEKTDGLLLTRTRNGLEIRSLLIVAGVGLTPGVDLADEAGIETEDGIVVNDRLQTSAPDVYAAGDNAVFPHQALGRRTRFEHWDNALRQGKQAGRNMAGADEPYTRLPYFFSSLFDLSYEAVGDVSPALETRAEWETENNTGVIYYLKQGRVSGALTCNAPDKTPAARELILRGERMTPAP